ncbi:MAG: Cof-type HAD-IIB family hydrolase [Bacteroidales bacterium]|nr:Cof-type HAD-IIB family hydrolase [Bacteroidales bacterium]
MIKALFLDVDGTIISIKTKKIPQSAVEAVRRIRKAGVKVFICTSRASQFLSNVKGFEYDGVVALTGAHCIDSEGVTIQSSPMDYGDIAAAITDVERSGRPFVVLTADKVYIQDPYSPEVTDFFATGGLTVDEVTGVESGIPDFLSTDDPVGLAKELGVLQVTGFFPSGTENDRFLSLMPHSHSERWNERFVDIVGNGISKGNGIDVMAARFGFDISETMGVGDGANDIPMIRHAGIGVAMGNASDIVKQSAVFVTGEVDEDGLATAIEKYIL